MRRAPNQVEAISPLTSSQNVWRSVLTSPTDENLKNAYVEALKAEGNPRAELFPLAQELDDLIHGNFQRETELKAQCRPLGEAWRQELMANAILAGSEIKFVRGWPVELTLPASQFAVDGAEILAIIPVLHLNLKEVSEALAVFGVEALQQIVSIDASDQVLTSEAIAALTSSSNLTSLRWLNLSSTGLRDAAVERLAAAPNLRQLVHLDLRRNPCQDPVDAVAGCGVDGLSGYIVPESIWLPNFGRELEAKYGYIGWLHVLSNFLERYPPSRYQV